MNPFTRPLSAVILLAATMVLPLPAQEKEKEKGKEKPVEISLRLIAFTPDLQIAEAYAHDPAADDSEASVLTPVKTYLNHEFLKVKTASGRFVFTTKADRESITRQGELIGEVTLPEKATSALLVFFPVKAGETAKCKIVAFDDSKKAFPQGTYLAANISDLPARLTLEKTDFDFEPNEIRLLGKPPLREGGVAGMHAFMKQDDAWKQFATGLWSDPGSGRSLKIFFQSPDNGKFQIRAFDDVPPRETEEAAKTSKSKKKKKAKN